MTVDTDPNDFGRPDFCLDEYLASVVNITHDSKTAPFATAAATRDAFATARDRLASHAAAAARRAHELESVAKDVNNVFLSQISDVATDAVALEATLDALEDRVGSVAAVARDAGGKLRQAEQRRGLADNAVTLAGHLTAFDSCAYERLSLTVDSVFFDEGKVSFAAAVARQLLHLAREMREAANSRSVTLGVTTQCSNTPSTSGFLKQATDNLERYCDGLENRLLKTFEAAESSNDDAAALAAATVLEKFSRGTQCARRFVATRPMFIDVSALEEIAELFGEAPKYTSGEIDCEQSAIDAANNASDAVSLFFQNVAKDTLNEADRIRKVFPEGTVRTALHQLTHRVVEQRIAEAVDAALGSEPPDAPEISVFQKRNSVRSSPTRNFPPKSTRKPPRSARSASHEALVFNPGTVRSAPSSPAKTSRAVKRAHRRAASVSVAAVSRFGEENESDVLDFSKLETIESFKRSDSLPSNVHESPLIGLNTLDGGISEDEVDDGDGKTYDYEDDEFVVQHPERAFPLLSYLLVFAELNESARTLANTLLKSTNGAVDIANAVDALFAQRRTRYDALEIACLKGMVAATVNKSVETKTVSPPASPKKCTHNSDDTAHHTDHNTQTMKSIARWYESAAQRVACVFAPPAGRDVSQNNEDDIDESKNQNESNISNTSSTFSREVGLFPHLKSDIQAAGLRLPGHGRKLKHATDKNTLHVQPDTTQKSFARAIAWATSLASAAAAENRVAEVGLREMTRVAAEATAHAVAVSTTRAKAFPAATKDDSQIDSASVAAKSVDACLGASLVAASAVSVGAVAVRKVISERAAAGDLRANTSSPSMQWGGDVAASAAAAARATADAATRSTGESLFKFETKAGGFVADAIHASLNLLFERIDHELKSKQKKNQFVFEFDDIVDPEAFPGAKPSGACGAALAFVKNAIDLFSEKLKSENDASSDENFITFVFEVIERLSVTVRQHFFELNRFTYSLAGALQLKRDLGEFESWTRDVLRTVERCSEMSSEKKSTMKGLKNTWRLSLDMCDPLLVPPNALELLLKETAASHPDDLDSSMTRFAKVVTLRKDFKESFLPADLNARTKHQRTNSSSFFGWRTESPPLPK